MKPAPPPATLDERVRRTNEVLARYRGRPFDWTARATCIHLFRAQAVAMGHAIPPVPQFRSALGARRVLAKMGHGSLADLLDALLPGRRIPAARLLAGDVVLLPGEPFEAVTIATGAGAKVLGWFDCEIAVMARADLSKSEWQTAVVGAWRLG